MAASRPPVPAAVSSDDVVGGPEERPHAGHDPGEHRGELGPAVVDHLARAGLADGRRQARRAWDPEVRLETLHGGLRYGSREATGRW